MGAYLETVEDGQLPLARAYHLNDEERLVREFVLQLKLGGVELEGFRKKFGVDVGDRFAVQLGKIESRGWLERTPVAIRMTRQGLLRVDRLLEDFYLPGHQDIGYW
jgi:oxygen-independent coproporphyrinogen-3 oxidase